VNFWNKDTGAIVFDIGTPPKCAYCSRIEEMIRVMYEVEGFEVKMMQRKVGQIL
jgi:hypothetical protein